MYILHFYSQSHTNKRFDNGTFWYLQFCQIHYFKEFHNTSFFLLSFMCLHTFVSHTSRLWYTHGHISLKLYEYHITCISFQPKLPVFCLNGGSLKLATMSELCACATAVNNVNFFWVAGFWILFHLVFMHSTHMLSKAYFKFVCFYMSSMYSHLFTYFWFAIEEMFISIK